jgi:hypothetical protein
MRRRSQAHGASARRRGARLSVWIGRHRGVAGAFSTLLGAGPAHADEPASRSLWLAPTYQLALTDAFAPSSRHGIGAAASYEFHISPTFDLGLALAYRLYPGESATHQLGYGATLKHFFSAGWSWQDGIYPYVDYGLLLQQTFIEGRDGNAVSHDTRLGVGAVIRAGGIPLFVGLSGHYSRLQYFDVKATNVHYLGAELGWVHTF